jgi:hypothetical protein
LRRILAPIVLAGLLYGPALLSGEDHVASSADLRNELRSAASTRRQNIAKLRSFLSTEVARKAMDGAHVDANRVSSAVALLSDEELVRLTAQAESVQNDFAAGSLTSFQITLIIVAAILLAVIVAIKAA